MSQPRPSARLFRSLIDFSRTVRASSLAWNGAGEHGLSRNEVVVLGLIADNDACRASSVSERMHVGPSVVSRLVSALSARGLLVREADPDDGRAELLRLTEEGRGLLSRARETYVESLSAHLHDWDPERIEAAAELLEDLTAALGRRPEEAR